MYYLMLMMTSWAIVCDVWYLPPMTKMVKLKLLSKWKNVN